MDLKLDEIGLTKGEIKTYLALAENGSLSKSGLSVKSGISSSKIYEIAEKLVKKGLVGQIKRNGKIIYQVNDPNRLMSFIEEREKKIALEKEIVKKAIPIINNLKNKNKDYRFEVLEGTEGIKQSLNEIMSEIKDNEEICGLGIEMKNISILHDYHKKRISKNITQRLIFSDKNIHWTKYKGKQNRFIPEITNIGIGITKNKIILASLGKHPVTLIIEHPEFNKSFKQIFEKLWTVAEK
ncbi:MAG: TrmB family transcriptional regulator [Candidatus Nanoarchaeia archaeon]